MTRMRQSVIIGLISAFFLSCQNNSIQNDSSRAIASAVPQPVVSAAQKHASAIALAIREAAKCPWLSDTSGATLDTKCPTYAAWEVNLDAVEGEAEADMIELISDADRNVRWIAATGLVHLTVLKTTYRKNATTSKVVLQQAREETDPTVGRVLGILVGRILLSKTQLSEPVLDLVRNGRDSVRLGMFDDLLVWNGDQPGVRSVVEAVVRAAGPTKVRSEAVRAIAARGLDDKDCKMLLDLMKDADAEVAGQAGYQAAGASGTAGCPKDFQSVMEEIENQSKKGVKMHQAMAGALGRIAEQGRATVGQKKQAVALARQLVETKTNPEDLRWRALEVVGERDPNAKAFAAKYKEDESSQVKGSAERILGRD